MESPSEKRWTDDDLVLIAMVDELCAGNDLSDETWHRLQTRWHPDALIQLLTLTGYYRMVSGVLNALRVPLDDGLAGWP